MIFVSEQPIHRTNSDIAYAIFFQGVEIFSLCNDINGISS